MIFLLTAYYLHRVLTNPYLLLTPHVPQVNIRMIYNLIRMVDVASVGSEPENLSRR